jgi:flagellar biogenesis protein FliO
MKSGFLMLIMTMSAILCISFVQTAPVFGDTATVTNDKPAEEEPGFLSQFYEREDIDTGEEVRPASPFWSVVKILFYTAIIGAIGYFTVKFIVKKSGVPSAPDDKIVEVILAKPLGMGNYLEIVKIGLTYYILGVSNEGTNFIDKIEDKETIDYIELNKASFKPKETKFVDLLKVFPPGKKIDRMKFMKDQKDKLKKL